MENMQFDSSIGSYYLSNKDPVLSGRSFLWHFLFLLSVVWNINLSSSAVVSLLYFAGPILRGKYPSTLKQSNALNILCCALFVRGEMFFCESVDHDDKDWKCSYFTFSWYFYLRVEAGRIDLKMTMMIIPFPSGWEHLGAEFGQIRCQRWHRWEGIPCIRRTQPQDICISAKYKSQWEQRDWSSHEYFLLWHKQVFYWAVTGS